MKDQFERNIDYLRLSVTDRCNLRCRYCMPPEGIDPCAHGEILSLEEILRLAGLFAKCGVRKIKLTGGEPLVRKNISHLVRGLKGISEIQEVTLTTNGLLLKEQLPGLLDAGIDGINISIDTLKEDCYRTLTRGGELKQVIEALDACCKQENLAVKVNTVTLEEYNLNEIAALAALAKDYPMDVRFIEMMPMGPGKEFAGYTQETVLKVLEEVYGTPQLTLEQRGNGPSVYYKLDGFCGRIGMISPMSHSFCEECNRIRLTAGGFLKPCLHHSMGIDLRKLLRSKATDTEILSAITDGIFSKPSRHMFCTSDTGNSETRSMYQIGG